jgi:hypothetical protein
MSKTDTFENDLLGLIFNGDAIANLADDAATSPLTNLYVSLHTADPGEAATQETNECSYTSYARVAVARTSGGWVVTSSSVSPAANIDFPGATGGNETATHMGIGTDATGAGKLLYSGTISPNITIASGVLPRISTATTITED